MCAEVLTSVLRRDAPSIHSSRNPRRNAGFYRMAVKKRLISRTTKGHEIGLHQAMTSNAVDAVALTGHPLGDPVTIDGLSFTFVEGSVPSPDATLSDGTEERAVPTSRPVSRCCLTRRPEMITM